MMGVFLYIYPIFAWRPSEKGLITVQTQIMFDFILYVPVNNFSVMPLHPGSLPESSLQAQKSMDPAKDQNLDL